MRSVESIEGLEESINRYAVYSDKEREEHQEKGHPFNRLAYKALEEVIIARNFGALQSRVDEGVPGFDRHLRSHPLNGLAEAA